MTFVALTFVTIWFVTICLLPFVCYQWSFLIFVEAFWERLFRATTKNVPWIYSFIMYSNHSFSPSLPPSLPSLPPSPPSLPPSPSLPSSLQLYSILWEGPEDTGGQPWNCSQWECHRWKWELHCEWRVFLTWRGVSLLVTYMYLMVLFTVMGHGLFINGFWAVDAAPLTQLRESWIASFYLQ